MTNRAFFLLALLVVSGCYLKQLPITNEIAREGTYHVAVQTRDGAERRGDAWTIDAHHLVTAGTLCANAENVALLINGGVTPVLIRIDDARRLCLIDVPRGVALGLPMVVARAWNRRSRHLGEVGSPMWSPLGVVGVVLRIDGGRVTSSATRSELVMFARAQGVEPTIAPPLSDVDMDISCQQGAKAMGWCSTTEPGGVMFPGEE